MKRVLTIMIGALLPLFVHSQAWEVGVMLGGSNYSGDLSPTPVVFKETNIAGGGFVKYNVNKTITFKGNAYYGTISGSDANAERQQNRERNLSFRSRVLEIGINGELNLHGYEVGSKRYRTAPYLFGGLAIFKFDPEAYFADTKEWIRLQPLGTEGQGTTLFNDRKKYALTQVCIPFGLGLKHNFIGNWTVGAELGWRKTFTDYLDDVSLTYVDYEYLARNSGELTARLSNRTGEVLSQRREFNDRNARGNSTNMDWYMFGGITLSYTLMPKKCYEF